MAAKSNVWSGRRAAKAIRASSAKGEGGSDLTLQGRGMGRGGEERGGEGRGSGMALATMRLASPPQKEVYPRLCSAVQTANSTVHLEVIGGRRTLEREEVCSGAGQRQRRTWLAQLVDGKQGLSGHTYS